MTDFKGHRLFYSVSAGIRPIRRTIRIWRRGGRSVKFRRFGVAIGIRRAGKSGRFKWALTFEAGFITDWIDPKHFKSISSETERKS